MTKRLFHGTANYSLKSFLDNGVQKRYRSYLDKDAFCTATKFQEAAFFALRKTPINDLTQTGIVLEFQGKNMVKEIDYTSTEDKRAIRHESEIAIFNTNKIKLIAYWKYDKGWKRICLN